MDKEPRTVVCQWMAVSTQLARVAPLAVLVVALASEPFAVLA